MLREMKRPEFADVYALMELSFPPDERRPYAAQRALLDRPGYRIYVPADGPYALLAVWETPEFLFLEHFAVSPERRGAGLGAALLAALLARAQRQLVLEVELPQTEPARRRIGFYTRNGLFLNRYDYAQPPLGPGQGSVSLLLMTSGAPVSEPVFRTIRDRLYRDIYGVWPNK